MKALWSGLILSVVAFFSYFVLFARWPVTRDVPWVNAILFAGAIALVVIGWRKTPRKILGSIVAILAITIAAGFAYAVTLGSRLPMPQSPPRVGDRAPQFALLDANRRNVTLSQLLADSPKGVLLIFYRGYW